MSVFSHVTLGYDDVAKAKAFYNDVLKPLGLASTTETDTLSVYSDGAGGPLFIVLKPSNGQPASVGNGLTVAFLAPSRAAVDDFHKRALANGAKDEGAPGPRSFAPNAYAAYFRDTGGHKICAYCYKPE